MKSNLILFLVATSASIAFISHLRAATVVREQFLTTDYTVNQTVVGQAGGTGFTGAWSENGGLSSAVNFYPRASGLSYSDLSTSGGQLEHFRELTSTSPATSKLAIRDFSFAPPTISGASQIYMGFLFEVSSGADFKWSYNDVQNRISDLTVTASGNATFTGGGSTGSVLNLGSIQSGTNMLLLRVTDATSGSPNDSFYDEIEAWLNPDLTNLGMADEFGYGIISKFNGTNTDLQPGAYSLNASLAAGQSFRFDKFFITDDLNDVVVVIPEPSSAILLLLGSMALLRRRR